MAALADLGVLVETDVLVIGAGLAGLFAAARAREITPDVTLVDKGAVGFTGQGFWALGGVQALLPGDDLDAWLEEVVYFEDGLCEQDMVARVYRQSYDRIRDFEELGLAFTRNDGGGYRRFTTRGLSYIRGLRPHPHGSGGARMTRAIWKKARRLGVRMLDRIFITSVLTRDGVATGAVGFDVVSGRFHVFTATAVIIATGLCSFKGGSAAQEFATGDGMALALEAGAALRNLEFITIWMQPAAYTFEGAGTSLPMGAVFVNALGEPVMGRYAPSGTPTSNVDYTYIARACAFEARAGRAPFYLDHAPVRTADLHFIRRRAGWMGLHLARLAEAGIDEFGEKQEWAPVFREITGIQADLNCQTSVPGLFAAGRVRSLDPGVTMGSWAIATAVGTGHIAGQSAGEYARACPRPPIDVARVRDKQREVFGLLRDEGVAPEDAVAAIQKSVFAPDVCLVKRESSLRRALREVNAVQHDLVPRLRAKDSHDLGGVLEVRNMATLAEMMLEASLMRTESRAAHYREDHPHRDDRNWLKWIVARRHDEGFRLHTEALPLPRYPIKPARCYSDNFVFPGSGQ